MKLQLEERLRSLLRQRANFFWLRDGDANTKFFHQAATNLKRVNAITGLFDEVYD